MKLALSVCFFLSILGESEPVKENKVDVGIDARQTDRFKYVGDGARTIRNKSRKAFNMPLVMEVQTMYEEVSTICQKLSGSI